MTVACPHPSSACEPLREVVFALVLLIVAGQPVFVAVAE